MMTLETFNQIPKGDKNHEKMWNIFVKQAQNFDPPIHGTTWVEKQQKIFRPDATIITTNNEILWVDVETKYKYLFQKITQYSFIIQRGIKGKPKQIIFITDESIFQGMPMVYILNEKSNEELKKIDKTKKDFLKTLVKIGEIFDFGVRLFLVNLQGETIQEVKL